MLVWPTLCLITEECLILLKLINNHFPGCGLHQTVCILDWHHASELRLGTADEQESRAGKELSETL